MYPVFISLPNLPTLMFYLFICFLVCKISANSKAISHRNEGLGRRLKTLPMIIMQKSNDILLQFTIINPHLEAVTRELLVFMHKKMFCQSTNEWRFLDLDYNNKNLKSQTGLSLCGIIRDVRVNPAIITNEKSIDIICLSCCRPMAVPLFPVWIFSPVCRHTRWLQICK